MRAGSHVLPKKASSGAIAWSLQTVRPRALFRNTGSEGFPSRPAAYSRRICARARLRPLNYAPRPTRLLPAKDAQGEGKGDRSPGEHDADLIGNGGQTCAGGTERPGRLVGR